MSPLSSKTWVVGTIIFVTGSLLNFASYAFAAQSMLASLESIQFVTNLLFGRFMLGATVTKAMFLGTCLTVVGTVVAVQFSSKSTLELNTEQIKNLYLNPAYIVYLCLMVAMLVALHLLYRVFEKFKDEGRPLRGSDLVIPLAYSVWSALFGTQSVVQAKVLAELLAVTGEEDIFKSWFTYLTIVLWASTASVWLKRLNDALTMFNPLFIIPLLQCSFIFFAIISGGIFFREFEEFELYQWIGFWVGVLIMFGGLGLLTPRSRPTVQHDGGDNDDEEDREKDLLAREVVGLLTANDGNAGKVAAETIRTEAGAPRLPSTPPSTPRDEEGGTATLPGVDDDDDGGDVFRAFDEGASGGTGGTRRLATALERSDLKDGSARDRHSLRASTSTGVVDMFGRIRRSTGGGSGHLGHMAKEAMMEIAKETAHGVGAAFLMASPSGPATAALTGAMVDATREKERRKRTRENLARLRSLLADEGPHLFRGGGDLAAAGRTFELGEDAMRIIRELEIDTDLLERVERAGWQRQHQQQQRGGSNLTSTAIVEGGETRYIVGGERPSTADSRESIISMYTPRSLRHNIMVHATEIEAEIGLDHQ